MAKKSKGFPKQLIYGVMVGLFALSMGCNNKKPKMQSDAQMEQSEDMNDNGSMTPKESMGALYDDDTMMNSEDSMMNQKNRNRSKDSMDQDMDQDQDESTTQDDDDDAMMMKKKNQSQQRPNNNGSYNQRRQNSNMGY